MKKILFLYILIFLWSCTGKYIYNDGEKHNNDSNDVINVSDYYSDTLSSEIDTVKINEEDMFIVNTPVLIDTTYDIWADSLSPVGEEYIESEDDINYMEEGLQYIDEFILDIDLDDTTLSKNGNGKRVIYVEDSLETNLPIVMNKSVKFFLEYFQGRYRSHFTRYLERAGKYLPTCRAMFKSAGIPSDLVYLALIESGFNYKAYSRAHAVGMWQFITGTGRRYGLKIDWWYDERRDFIKSTKAAIEYLKDLYDMFGDWYLALAAYNSGEGRVARVIRRTGSKDFWVIRRHLPRETRNYVPQIIAGMIIAKEPEKFGFEPLDFSQKPLPEFDEVKLDFVIGLDVAADLAGTTVEMIKELNPSIRRMATPPNISNFMLRIPKGKKEVFEQKLAELPPDKRLKWYEYRVKSGDSLWKIAKKFGTTIYAVKSANNLRTNRLQIGQRLTIPAHTTEYAKLNRTKTTSVKSKISEKVQNEYKSKGQYVVQLGDNLYWIAKRNRVSLSNLMKWNNLNKYSKIYPGDILYIKDPGDLSLTKSSDITGKTKLVYRVRKGDSLWKIADKYSISIGDLQSWNNLTSSRRIYPGQKLMIYSNLDNADAYSSSKLTHHRVRKGENLSLIADRYNVSLAELYAWNGLNSRSRIYPGQKIKLYKENDSKQTDLSESDSEIKFHTVKKGENLSYIASRYGVSLNDIMSWNSISSASRIYPGQKLKLFNTVKTDATQDKQAEYHKVIKGENLSYIAEKYNISINDIMEWNDISKNENIYPGQNLAVSFSSVDTKVSVTGKDENNNYHIVKKGENLSYIADKYNISMSDLMKWNSISKNENIYPGQKLSVSFSSADTKTDKDDNTLYHIVRKGENLSNIASKYGTTLSSLLEWNNLNVRSSIFPGDKLLIKNTDRNVINRVRTNEVKQNNTEKKKYVYRVHSGDNLWSIAKIYNVSISDIRKWNNLKNNETLYPGKKLVLYVDDSIKDDDAIRIKHIVRKGENLWDISKKYNTSVTNIIRWNQLSKNSKIYPGDKLDIYIIEN